MMLRFVNIVAYYLVTIKTMIVMDAPPEHEDVKPFIKIANFLSSNNLSAPKIIAKDEENGFLLLEDFGNISYNKALKEQNSMNLAKKELDLYEKACDVLLDLHKIPNKPQNIALYDSELLLKEVMLFIDWYLPYIAKKPANQEQINQFQEEWLRIFQKIK